MTNEEKELAFRLYENGIPYVNIKTSSNEKKTYLVYYLQCEDTKLYYYDIIDDLPTPYGIIFFIFSDMDKYRIKNMTLYNPTQYIQKCFPLYHDIVIFGTNRFNFGICATGMSKEQALCCWAYNNSMRNRSYYENVESCEFNGIMCLETGEIYPTVGKAAKAVGLKSRNSILKALNDYNKTAAKYHWCSLDKLKTTPD